MIMGHEDFEVAKTDQEWRQTLTPEQFQVLREHGTEPPGASSLNREKRDGTFACAGCGQPLFSSETKFESGTGWPSFTDPIDVNHIVLKEDVGFFTKRTEVLCSNCGGHLGHLFNDGPKPARTRYC